MARVSTWIVVLALIVLLSSPSVDAVKRKDRKKKAREFSMTVDYLPPSCNLKSKNGDTLSIHYTGTFDDGRVFDSSYHRNVPIDFTLGVGQVIKGWDVGLADMCIGEKRTLDIPPDMGYGAMGVPRSIPGNSFLKFEAELIKINGLIEDLKESEL
mmetsp:Transcript_39260/g.47554  ORF Transcript_39260/g.47554 Transcript_39260/m.47554 type:complete len:155 (-) Transcript_39260:497-961(-)|eukprot:CAMPEP_0197850208 /NCGR_PEP_ID=MMETSP1438-20131217/14627_1 /TAXON_ID=1461541 /ORGANISM="Pterosperma sp., Strain CCMP1384" /LENGTH=154 /DNA_ID=CAMNT_0043463245 /DNA_START=88 /DNA_END=552 /DNA_ORIENTATION=-